MPREPKKPHKPKKPPCLQVIITVSGGVADLLYKPPGLAVTVLDYDVEGSDAHAPGVSKDHDGHPCCIQEWDQSDEVIGQEHWPMVRRARKGDYFRTWKCPDCRKTIEHSYDALVEVGAPICTDCDTEMEML